MKYNKSFSKLMLIGVVAILISCQIELGEEHPNADFIGSWKLEKWTAKLADGSEIYPYGTAAYGKLIYEESGEMNGILMADNRAKMSTDDVGTRIAEEALTAFNSFFAYAGPYEINRDSSYVIHRVEACINPNWVGREQKRFFSFENGNLILSTPPIAVQGTRSQAVHQTLVWRKVN